MAVEFANEMLHTPCILAYAGTEKTAIITHSESDTMLSPNIFTVLVAKDIIS